MKNAALIVSVLLFFNFLLTFEGVAKNNAKLSLQKATHFQEPEDISQYWLSEKLDGIRGYWDGSTLYFRSGKPINAPNWFTQNWPNTPLDGELWIDRDKFEQVSSCVRKHVPGICWQQIKFMIFDLPAHQGTFNQRVAEMKQLTKQNKNPYLDMIKQFTCADTSCLYQIFNEVISKQGEGLMLHAGGAYYHQGRTANLMKLKPSYDAEARVIKHIAGKGKYHGMLGSLLVRTPEGVEFKIGTGFSDQDRRTPPEVGDIVTYKYSGKTHKGVPRFASFVRIRNE